MSGEPAAFSPSAVEVGRRVYRRRQSGRSVLASLASTLVFAVAVGWGVSHTPGWPNVRATFLDWGEAVRSFPLVLQGFWLNVRVLCVSLVGIALLATLLAAMRTLRGPVFFPLRALAIAYTDLMRGVPLLLVLYLIGFGVPGLGLTNRLPAEFWGTIALVASYSGYVAEVLRAGIDSVHPSQREAARSLGLGYAQTLRLVILPQAIRNVTPALMNDFVSLQKDVGLISVLGAVDAVRAAQIEVAQTYNFTPYVVAGLIFVAFAWPAIRVTDWITARQRARQQAGGLV